MSEDKDIGNINSETDNVVAAVKPPVKVKNPNMAAGKKLAENNKLEKEHYNKLILDKMEKEKIVPGGGGSVAVERNEDCCRGGERNNGVFYVIVFAAVGGLGYYCYNKYNDKPASPQQKPVT